MTDTIVTAASPCAAGGLLPPMAPDAVAASACRAYNPGYSSAGVGKCPTGTTLSTATGKCSSGALPTCPSGSMPNPNGIWNASAKVECVSCLAGTRQTAAGSKGPFTCLAPCPAGTAVK